MAGDHFIPFRRSDIVTLCADELPPAEAESFRAFAAMLASLLHHRFHERIEALKEAYQPFNPEADTRTVTQPTPAEAAAAQATLEAELTDLARAANFTAVDLAELTAVFTQHSLLKVRMEVDTGDLDKILLFRRGTTEQTKPVRTWWGLRRRNVTFLNDAKVLVYARFKPAEHFADQDVERLPFRPGSTIIKLFQNVPRADLEMVFPNVEVRMRGIDKWLIGVPAVVSGIVIIATKLVTSLGLLLLLVAFWLGLYDKPVELNKTALFTIGAGLVAFGGYLVRQVNTFKNRKITFMKTLSESLYFRNLDNDAGVFHNLLDAAEEAEVIEALLAYHFLRTAPGPLTATDLDRRIEAAFRAKFDLGLDFDIADGRRKLLELGLVTEDGDGRLHAVTLSEAKLRISEIWHGLLQIEPVTPTVATRN